MGLISALLDWQGLLGDSGERGGKWKDLKVLCKFKGRGGRTIKNKYLYDPNREIPLDPSAVMLRFCHCYQTFVHLPDPYWEEKATGVVDLSQALPPPTQVEFSTLFLLQILIKAPRVNSGLIVW